MTTFTTAIDARNLITTQTQAVEVITDEELSLKYQNISELIVAAATANLYEAGVCVTNYPDRGTELVNFLIKKGYTVSYDKKKINILISWRPT